MKKLLWVPFAFLLPNISCKKNASSGSENTPVQDSVITTIAGNGSWGYSGDGGAATSAQLYYCRRVAVDKAGNIFIADAGNDCIRKVNTAGIITTIAGTGINGFSGDNGPANLAKLSSPAGIVVDAFNNIYFADKGNYRIRKITAAGIITTVAGGGPWSSGTDGDGSLATLATLNLPEDVAIDSSGNLIIADWGNHKVRKVNINTGIITKIAGNNTQGYTGDGGPAVNAGVQYPTGVAVDKNGNVLIASNHTIRKISSSGIITTVAGTGNIGINGNGGPAISANIWPDAITVNNINEIITAEYDPGVIRKISSNGIISIVAGGGNSLGDGGNPRLAELIHSSGVCADMYGNIFIADYGARRIRKVSKK